MTRLLLLVERDTSTRVPVEVHAFERPVLDAIHGAEMVHEIDILPPRDEPLDVEEAHDRLRTKYGDVALQVYPNVQALERELKRLGATLEPEDGKSKGKGKK